MGESEFELFAAKLNQNLPKLDLHGFFPSDISSKIDIFLVDLQRRGEKSGQVVFGHGRGILRNAALTELRDHPLVKGVELRDDGGSCVIILED